MTYKVDYTAFSNNEWHHRCGSCVVEAASESEARDMVLGWSNYFEEYYIDKVVIMK